MGKFERKFGKYAIQNLSLILIICYAVGYLIEMIPNLSSLLAYLTLDPYLIVHGQIWRLVTWIIVPPSSFQLTTLITLFFYYSIGRSLERTWGDFLYNVYIFSGMLFTVVGAFLLFLFYFLKTGNMDSCSYIMNTISYYISTYYVNMSIFLAFAATFPEAQVLLMFIIPIKVKWLGVLYAVLLVYEFIASPFAIKVVIFMSILNFLVFFVVQRYTKYGSPKMRMQNYKRRKEFKEKVDRSQKIYVVSKHKCAICGRTGEEYPDLTFRFCSKCNGNYEYCEDHLFTHQHIE